MSADWLSAIASKFPSAKIDEAGGFGPRLRTANLRELPSLAAHVRLHFDRLEDYTALDSGEVFTLVLHFVRSADHAHLTVTAEVPRAEAIAPTLTAVYGSADWFEREIFDLFGIRFAGHPDLRRILLPEDWIGHPLRKDYTDDKILKRPGALG